MKVGVVFWLAAVVGCVTAMKDMNAHFTPDPNIIYFTRDEAPYYSERSEGRSSEVGSSDQEIVLPFEDEDLLPDLRPGSVFQIPLENYVGEAQIRHVSDKTDSANQRRLREDENFSEKDGKFPARDSSVLPVSHLDQNVESSSGPQLVSGRARGLGIRQEPAFPFGSQANQGNSSPNRQLTVGFPVSEEGASVSFESSSQFDSIPGRALTGQFDDFSRAEAQDTGSELQSNVGDSPVITQFVDSNQLLFDADRFRNNDQSVPHGRHFGRRNPLPDFGETAQSVPGNGPFVRSDKLSEFDRTDQTLSGGRSFSLTASSSEFGRNDQSVPDTFAVRNDQSVFEDFKARMNDQSFPGSELLDGNFEPMPLSVGFDKHESLELSDLDSNYQAIAENNRGRQFENEPQAITQLEQFGRRDQSISDTRQFDSSDQAFHQARRFDNVGQTQPDGVQFSTSGRAVPDFGQLDGNDRPVTDFKQLGRNEQIFPEVGQFERGDQTVQGWQFERQTGRGFDASNQEPLDTRQFTILDRALPESQQVYVAERRMPELRRVVASKQPEMDLSSQNTQFTQREGQEEFQTVLGNQRIEEEIPQGSLINPFKQRDTNFYGSSTSAQPSQSGTVLQTPGKIFNPYGKEPLRVPVPGHFRRSNDPLYPGIAFPVADNGQHQWSGDGATLTSVYQGNANSGINDGFGSRADTNFTPERFSVYGVGVTDRQKSSSRQETSTADADNRFTSYTGSQIFPNRDFRFTGKNFQQQRTVDADVTQGRNFDLDNFQETQADISVPVLEQQKQSVNVGNLGIFSNVGVNVEQIPQRNNQNIETFDFNSKQVEESLSNRNAFQRSSSTGTGSSMHHVTPRLGVNGALSDAQNVAVQSLGNVGVQGRSTRIRNPSGDVDFGQQTGLNFGQKTQADIGVAVQDAQEQTVNAGNIDIVPHVAVNMKSSSDILPADNFGVIGDSVSFEGLPRTNNFGGFPDLDIGASVDREGLFPHEFAQSQGTAQSIGAHPSIGVKVQNDQENVKVGNLGIFANVGTEVNKPQQTVFQLDPGRIDFGSPNFRNRLGNAPAPEVPTEVAAETERVSATIDDLVGREGSSSLSSDFQSTLPEIEVPGVGIPVIDGDVGAMVPGLGSFDSRGFYNPWDGSTGQRSRGRAGVTHLRGEESRAQHDRAEFNNGNVKIDLGNGPGGELLGKATVYNPFKGRDRTREKGRGRGKARSRSFVFEDPEQASAVYKGSSQKTIKSLIAGSERPSLIDSPIKPLPTLGVQTYPSDYSTKQHVIEQPRTTYNPYFTQSISTDRSNAFIKPPQEINDILPYQVPLVQPPVEAVSSTITGDDVVNSIDVLCDTGRRTMVVDLHFAAPFDGAVYSKGYFKQPLCNTPINGLRDARIEIPLDGCGTEENSVGPSSAFEEPSNSFSNTIIIMNDRVFKVLWSTDRAYTIKCNSARAPANKRVSAGITVPMVSGTTLDPFIAAMPNIFLKVVEGKDPRNDPTNTLIVGELATVVIYYVKSVLWDIWITDCHAHSGIQLGRVELIDGEGCPVNRKIIGFFNNDPKYNTDGFTYVYAIFKAFKFPDKENVYFECNVNICQGECSQRQCPAERPPGKRRRKRSAEENASVDAEQAIRSPSNVTGQTSVYRGVKLLLFGEKQLEEQGDFSQQEGCVDRITLSSGISVMSLLITTTLATAIVLFVQRRRQLQEEKLVYISKDLSLHSFTFTPGITTSLH